MSVKGFKLSDGTSVLYDYRCLENTPDFESDIATINQGLGNLLNLVTEEKSDLVSAINEVYANAGNDVEVINKKLYIDGVPQDIKSVDVQVIDGVLYIDGTAREIQGMNGTGISNIAKTNTSGLIDTYTITMTDGDTYVFTVTNGDADDTKIKNYIESWLDNHPDATTTVEDASITMAKLSGDTKAILLPRANHTYLYNSSQPEGTSTFAELFQKVKKEVMNEYRGNIDKIPFILTTDHHGQLAGRQYVFEAINSVVNWYDISKVFNLGDVVTSTWGTYTDTPYEFTTNGQLGNMMTVTSPIPMDKQINVFGNHDTWSGKLNDSGYKMIPQNLLTPYFRNAQGHRMSNAGYFSVKDDYFNVKYVVVSGFEYINGVGANVSNESASTEQIAWLIKELGTDDGYDIVMVSHEPLFPDWESRSFESTYPRPSTSSKTGTVNNTNRWAWLYTDDIFLARKNKTSGSFKDRSGVTHTFDFSGLTGNLLCGFDGHLHFDCSQYTGNDEFLCESFGSFKPDQGGFLYFGLIDRENSQLNIWKIHYENLYYENYQVPFSIPETAGKFTIKRRLRNTETYQISRVIREGQPFFDIIFPKSGYTVGYVKVLMNDVDVTDVYYNSDTKRIAIPSVTGDIDITAYDSNTDASTLVWTVTNYFDNCAAKNTTKVYGDEYYEHPICVLNGGTYTSVINPNGKMCIYYISALHGNTDVTDTLTVNRSSLTLSIPNVGADITVIGKALPHQSVQGIITVNGEFDSSNTTCCTTAYLPMDGTAIGRFRCSSAASGQWSYISFYDENHSFISRAYLSSNTAFAYVPYNSKYVRLSIAKDSSYPYATLITDKNNYNCSVAVTGNGVTIGSYPSTIRTGNSVAIPFTYSGEGRIKVDTCKTGGANANYVLNDNDVVIPYTSGDVELTIRFIPRELYSLTNQTLTNTTLDTLVNPTESLDSSFTIMVDYVMTACSANASKVYSHTVYFERKLAGLNQIRFWYTNKSYEPTTAEVSVPIGTRCKLVATHLGGADSYTTKFYVITENMDAPFVYELTNAGGATSGQRVATVTAKLGSGTATITYNNVKILSVVATEQEINDFLAFD